MPFQDIARLIDWYRNEVPRPVKSLIYAGVIYGGLNELGDSIGKSSGISNLDTLIDMTSSLTAGTYLANRLENQLRPSRWKELALAGIAAYVGADLASEFTGEHWSFIVEGAKNLYLNLSGMPFRQWIDSGYLNHRMAAEIVGFLIGGLTGGISRTAHHLGEFRAARAQRLLQNPRSNHHP